MDPLGGHGVFAGDRTDAQRVLVAALVAFDPDRLRRDEGGVGLPDRVIPVTLAKEVDVNLVGLLDDLDLLGGDLAGAAPSPPRQI